jgi:hypothetical protein
MKYASALFAMDGIGRATGMSEAAVKGFAAGGGE